MTRKEMERVLPNKYVEYLYKGAVFKNKPKDKIENEIVLRLIQKCYSKPDIKSILDKGYKESIFHQDKEWFNKTYNSASLVFNKKLNTSDTHKKINTILLYIKYLPMTANERLVLKEILLISLVCESFEKLVIHRHYIAEEFNITEVTIGNVLHAFQNKYKFVTCLRVGVKDLYHSQYKIDFDKLYNTIISGVQKGKLPEIESQYYEANVLSDKHKKELKSTGIIMYELFHDNYKTWYTQTEIVNKLNLSIASVLKGLKILQKQKHIKLRFRQGRTGRRVNQYKFFQ